MSKTKRNNRGLETNGNAGHMQREVAAHPMHINTTLSSHASLNMGTNNYTNDSSKFQTLKKSKKFDKSQISGPTNFRVVQHVGLTNNNFEVHLKLNCGFGVFTN